MGCQETRAAYLKSVVCDFDRDSPWRSWKTVLPWQKLQEQVRILFEDDSELMTVEAVKKNESGAVTQPPGDYKKGKL